MTTENLFGARSLNSGLRGRARRSSSFLTTICSSSRSLHRVTKHTSERGRRVKLILQLSLVSALLQIDPAVVFAQTTPNSVPPRRVTDGRGVDLVSGDMPIRVPLVSFGEQATALGASFEISPNTLRSISGNFIDGNGGLGAGWAMAGALRPLAYSIGADGSPDEFGPYDNIVFPNAAGFAQQFTQYPRGNPDGSWNIHINPDGSRYTHSFGTTHFTRFQSPDPNASGVYDAAGDRAIPAAQQPEMGYERFDRIVLANGEEWRFYRQFITIPCTVNCQTSTDTLSRLRFATSSRGYGFQILYLSDVTPASRSSAGSWVAPRQMTGYNKTATYCDESLLQECPAVSALPSAVITYNSGAGTVLIRPPGSVTHGTELTFSLAWPNPVSIRQTAVSNSTVSFLFGSDNVGTAYISRVTDSDGQWNYGRTVYTDDSGHTPLMTAGSTNPAGNTLGIYGYGIFGTIQTYTDELSRTYNYSDGFAFRDWGRSEPEFDETLVDRDERNNITAITRYPKPNTGLPPRTVYQASYPVDCSNPRTCNRPTSITDGNGNTSTYTYAPEHGGVLTETGPLAPTRQSDGSMANVRQQKRYEYAQRYAWIGNGVGGYMHASTPIWLLARERHCISTAPSGSSCAGGAADEVITDYDYGPDSGPNNLNLRGMTVTAYVNGAAVTQRTCYGYDLSGNKISETQPNAQLASCP